MTFPLQVTFRGMDHSEAIEGVIQGKVDRLRTKYHHIVKFRVAVRAPSSHHKHGDQYHIVVDASVPGSELVVNRAPPDHHAHDDVYVAIRDAFRAIERELEKHADRHERVRRDIR